MALGDGELMTQTLTVSYDEEAFKRINDGYRADQDAILRDLIEEADLSVALRQRIQDRAVDLIRYMREDGKPGLMDMFLAEYGLSTNEGIALMCLAEALLRVPDPGTIDALIEDKIAPHDWDKHLGKSQSALVNASTAALMLTGRVLDDDNSASVMGLLNRTVKRLGEPVVRVAVRRAMKEMGDQFVLGQTISQAIRRGEAERRKGYLYSYDMLGEAALTAEDAAEFYTSYQTAIEAIGAQSKGSDIQSSPGVSVKLSALHPRFEFSKQSRLETELVPRVASLARAAKDRGLGFNIDAEEADRLEPTLRVFEALLADPSLAGWDGLGLVIQAYGRRAAAVIDWLYATAKRYDRKVMVRLVKGAYWDTEVKRAQVDGVIDFPVFTKRTATDVSYMCCAKKLLSMTDRIYPQFATHNAQTAATVLELCDDRSAFEFQRLHGMGETLHHYLLKEAGTRCRIYAPVGPHKDLLAYLVRRLLENGANSSFVNQVIDRRLPATQIARDPVEKYRALSNRQTAALKNPTQLFAPKRQNSKGWDLRNRADTDDIEQARAPFASQSWTAEPLLAVDWQGDGTDTLINPANPKDLVGSVTLASTSDSAAALEAARSWMEADARTRAATLNRAADLYEANFGEIFAILTREAGKTQLDVVAELREAVDFLRYYANRALDLSTHLPAGVVSCISPWNFPLAIFTGQIAAALAAGNGVLAKPAETTPLVASLAIKLMHEAGVPREVLQFLPGHGRTVGQALVSAPNVAGACFTGSTSTAQAINRTLARNAQPDAFLIAETGGLNVGIIDSTALPEQAVRDTIVSAFQSTGQRCSALRCLYVQSDIADGFLDILFGAIDELELGDPWMFSTDVGPLISADAQGKIQNYIDHAKAGGRLLKQLEAPKDGYFVGPAVISIDSISDLNEEVFGPVLHVARFEADAFETVLEQVNATGYGLTFGLHTRIDERVRDISDQLSVGNIYVNRNQVGAIVESQPFGGEGLSGTGPKAGGPHYVKRFTQAERVISDPYPAPSINADQLNAALGRREVQPSQRLSKTKMPGPTGEKNELSTWPRGLVLCLGPTLDDARRQAGAARSMGCPAFIVAPGHVGEDGLDGAMDLEALKDVHGISLVALWSEDESVRTARIALADREGPVIPLVSARNVEDYCIIERHTCIDTTAAGGNASLLGEMDEEISS
jgi:RHH-type proline utilization regulon transcriptional repressor/proline dehydrogenase/delta 1-pyrroline-5-carboxylate dehydrogenase